MNTQTLSLPIYNLNNQSHSEPMADDYLYFPTFDPVELDQILSTGVIQTNDKMKKETSLRVMPGLSDCVDLYRVNDLRANFRTGIGLVLDSSKVSTYLPHHGPRVYQSLVRSYHFGDVHLDNSLVGLYAIKGDNSDLEIWHPELVFNHFLQYLDLRSKIVTNQNFEITDDFKQTKKNSAKSILDQYKVSNVFEFLHLMAIQYISKN